METGR